MPANQVSLSTSSQVVTAAMDSADKKEPWNHGEIFSPSLCCDSEREPPQPIWETQQGVDGNKMKAQFLQQNRRLTNAPRRKVKKKKMNL